MPSVNIGATHKFVIVLNEKAPIGKVLSATGQLGMSLLKRSTQEQQANMNFTPLLNPTGDNLISVSTCSFVVLKGTNGQLLTLYTKTRESGILSAVFTSTMSFNGIEEDLIAKTANTPLENVEFYGVGLFGAIEVVAPLTKKFSFFK